MKTKHIILRSRRAATRDIFVGPSAILRGAEVSMPEVTVDVEDIERRTIVTLTRETDVIAVAPAMPMRLIAPVAGGRWMRRPKLWRGGCKRSGRIPRRSPGLA